MDFIQSGISHISKQLIQHRKYNYCSDALDHYLYDNPHIFCKHFVIKNKRGENLSAMLLKKGVSDTCLVYAHGLGSNKVQVLSLVKNLGDQKNFHFCSFDFSGSGRSDGEYTTYGIREQDDVNAVLSSLDSLREYKKYILWGRSMGGVAIVLSQSRNLNSKVQCIILDSPFSSFEKAAVQLAAKNTIIPQKMISLILAPIKQHMKKEHQQMNPFNVNICEAIAHIETKILLIYSKDDSIIDYSHSVEISKHCRRNPFVIEITEDHNRPRKAQTYLQAQNFIQESCRMHEIKQKRSKSKGRGVSVISKQNSSNTINSAIRKSLCSSTGSSQTITKKTDRKMPINIGSFGKLNTQHSQQNNQYNKGSVIKSLILQKQGNLAQTTTRAPIKFKALHNYKGIFG